MSLACENFRVGELIYVHHVFYADAEIDEQLTDLIVIDEYELLIVCDVLDKRSEYYNELQIRFFRLSNGKIFSCDFDINRVDYFLTKIKP